MWCSSDSHAWTLGELFVAFYFCPSSPSTVPEKCLCHAFTTTISGVNLIRQVLLRYLPSSGAAEWEGSMAELEWTLSYQKMWRIKSVIQWEMTQDVKGAAIHSCLPSPYFLMTTQCSWIGQEAKSITGTGAWKVGAGAKHINKHWA